MKISKRLMVGVSIAAMLLPMSVATADADGGRNESERGLAPGNPYLAQTPDQRGDWFNVSKDRLRFGATLIGDDAWRVVAADTLVRKKPAPGWTFVLGTVTYKRVNYDLDHLWGNIVVRFRGGDGKVYSGVNNSVRGGRCPYSLDLTAATGDPEIDFTIPAAGKNPQFYPCAVVPSSALKGGVWLVDTYDVFFKPRKQYVEVVTTPAPEFPKGLTPLNPYRAQTAGSPGDWFNIPFYGGNYRVRFGPTLVGKPAMQAMQGGSELTPPTPGWSMVVATGVVENPTERSTAPFLNVIGPNFVGSDGEQYIGSDSLSPGGSCPWVPGDLYGRLLEAGASLEFIACAVVPDSAIPGGVWQLDPSDPFVIPQHNYIQAAITG